jgi:hypothetical protein
MCGAAMRITASITDGPTGRDILAHCGEPTAPPRIAPTRGPPPWDLPDAGPGGFDSHAQPAPKYEFDQRIAWQPRPSAASACDAGPARACGRRHALRTP